jgi:hypothetical protein
MFRNSLNHCCYNAVFVAAIVTSPLACAAAPSADTAGGNMLSTLLRTATPLSTRELGAIRGGFDISRGFTINFAFRQVESSGTKIIQSIEVPMTTLTLGSHNITPIVTTSTTDGIQNVTGGGGTTTLATTGATNTPIPNTSTSTSTPTPAPTTNNVQAPSNNINLTSTANGGATIVQSQLGGSGITNVISNTANNAMISQMTTMNIAIAGMSSWISQQRSSFSSGGGAFGSLGVLR